MASCPNALTIDSRSGRCFSSGREAGLVPDRVVNSLPVSQRGPQLEVLIAGFPIGRIVGLHLPRPIGPDDVRNAIHNALPGMRPAEV